MTKPSLPIEWIHGRIAVSFLVKDAQNAKEVWEASEGTAFVTLSATNYVDLEQMQEDIATVREVAPAVSLALGGGANPANWDRVFGAGKMGANHLNQPFPTSGYTKGVYSQLWVNAAVEPTGQPGVVKAPWLSGHDFTLSVDSVVSTLKATGVDAVKLHPIKGEIVMEELNVLAKAAGSAGILGFEPAGGVKLENVVHIVQTILSANVELVIPHIFSDAIDKESGKTRPDYVAQVVRTLREQVRV
ncbi:KDGP aldolase [Alicyclobacillus dauci]|uniref:KDGP aldolase n=1 Tax=Alicyclobacillus dauci TaxID=1475485 RepID=A0ABY6Z0M2_9BACL|nr:KDGP aldolase [Alicyclobacillus dauci]WAH36361.1 KDGP aldolase [Alicyclobacillus dauci]WAH39373.1 KDGP aldolase [Alicyclobacillus dauci]